MPNCPHYEAWSDRSLILQMAECFWYIPQAEKCSCVECEHYNEKCIYQDGAPNDKTT